MSGRRMFGVETEYAMSAFGPDGESVSREDCIGYLMRRAELTVPHVCGVGSADLFLANGSRLYVDAGQHPEMSSPEVLNPWDAVRYAKAGDIILERLAEGVRMEHDEIGQVLIFKGNVDYSGSGATWGSHESYLHCAAPECVRQQLIPHLVSRVVYTGAGGFNSRSAGLEFMLAPRAAHLTQAVSDSSTSNRGIVHTRDESLCTAGYQRQHLICGESLQSDIASWLRVGTTAVIVALVEAGVPCGHDVAVAAPVEALQVFARDPSCRATARMATGPPLTAVRIQRQYLAHARRHLGHPCMPPWTKDVCEQWSAMLDRLERAPWTVARTLDWGIKLLLYQDRARRRGVDWDTLPAWTVVVNTLEAARRALPPPAARLSGASVLAKDGPFGRAMRELGPYVKEHRLELTNLDAFLSLRQELFEVDTRFGQLGAHSLFRQLEASGTLDHGVPGVDAIEYAIEHPPAEGRAHVRGQVIRRVASDDPEWRCTWHCLVGQAEGAQLDLSDPFTEQEIWVGDRAIGESHCRPRGSVNAAAQAEVPSLWDEISALCSRVGRRTRL